MIKPFYCFVFALGISACTAKYEMPEAYNKNQKPEERSEYNGLSGYAQSLKDQKYLSDREMHAKCHNARLDLAEASLAEQKDKVDQLKTKIKAVCI